MSSLNKDLGEFVFSLDPKEEASAELVARVGGELQRVFEERKKNEKLTKQDLATLLDVDRSRIHRCLSGYNNLTLATVAELAWAMEADISFSMTCREKASRTCNFIPNVAQHYTSATIVNSPVRAADTAHMTAANSRNSTFGEQKWQ